MGKKRRNRRDSRGKEKDNDRNSNNLSVESDNDDETEQDSHQEVSTNHKVSEHYEHIERHLDHHNHKHHHGDHSHEDHHEHFQVTKEHAEHQENVPFVEEYVEHEQKNVEVHEKVQQIDNHELSQVVEEQAIEHQENVSVVEEYVKHEQIENHEQPQDVEEQPVEHFQVTEEHVLHVEHHEDAQVVEELPVEYKENVAIVEEYVEHEQKNVEVYEQTKEIENHEQPQDVEEQPQDVEEQPHDVEEQPQDVEEQPHDVEEQPHDVEEQPHDVEEQPHDVEEQPHDVEEQPQDVEEQPVEHFQVTEGHVPHAGHHEGAQVVEEQPVEHQENAQIVEEYAEHEPTQQTENHEQPQDVEGYVKEHQSHEDYHDQYAHIEEDTKHLQNLEYEQIVVEAHHKQYEYEEHLHAIEIQHQQEVVKEEHLEQQGVVESNSRVENKDEIKAEISGQSEIVEKNLEVLQVIEAHVERENVVAVEEHVESIEQASRHGFGDIEKTEVVFLESENKTEHISNVTTSTSFPPKLAENLHLFDESERMIVEMLLANGQGHLFDNWDSPGVNDDKKKLFFEQVKLLDQGCSSSGGLTAYIQRAKNLLKASARAENLFDDWIPSIPTGVWLDPSNPSFEEFELEGLEKISKCAFVLVAGGLGERLGFNDIKVALPSETITNTCYLELYIKTILAYQQKYASNGQTLPLVIMVSDDTISRTCELLESNEYFGMQRGQVILMKQEKVAALKDNDAHFTLESDCYTIETRPHGHGDVHSLLFSTGLAEEWKLQGFEYVIFFQDTNGLGLFSLPACIGVTKKLDLEVNSIAIPRKAEQAIGAIVKLQKKTGEHLTVNVEYNQLDMLLRANFSVEGDVNDSQTGYSVFPGNINQLIFKLEPYVENLKISRGIISEFVNPKYTDETRFTFTKPTRLECMMQDYPKTLSSDAKVGFTGVPEWLCFSPVKNNLTLAHDAAKKGIHPACPASGEADQYRLYVKLLELIGAIIELAEPQNINGINLSLGPQIVFDPFFVSSLHELKRKFPQPSEVSISANSTLVIKGANIIVSSLKLNGALVIDEKNDAQIINSSTHNRGNKLELVSNNSNEPEYIKIRGYRFVKVPETLDTPPPQIEETKAEEIEITQKVPKSIPPNVKAPTSLPKDTENSLCSCTIL